MERDDYRMKDSLLDWWPVIASISGWVVTSAIQWTMLKTRLNGLGGRVRKVEASCEAQGAQMDKLERDLSEFRGEARSTSDRLSRVEKGIADVGDAVTNGNLALGSQLNELMRAITKSDKETSNRLVRIETVQQIEKKIGPIPVE